MRWSVFVLGHGLSIKVSAQGLLIEQNNGKRIVAGWPFDGPGGSEQINSTLSLLFDDKAAQQAM